MSESRDPAIKLFGRTIALPPCNDAAASSSDESGGGEEDKELSKIEASSESKGEDHESQKSEERSETTGSNSQKSSCANQESAMEIDSKGEEQQNAASDSQEKQAPKKPDKILPCPRCSSLDTKFCYYNNYNVNQPRYFCKNCQRYWTAGGTMRNVPVGAGRRKNKSSAAPSYRHLTIPNSTLQTLQSKVPESICNSRLKSNGSVLSFGSDTHLCASMANVLNGFYQTDEKMAPSTKVLKNGDEQPSRSSATSSNYTEQRACANLQQAAISNSQGVIPQIPFVPYPWSPAPAFCASSSFAIPIYPTATYWGCPVPPGTWSIPWISSPPAASPPNAGGSSGTAPTSPSLGKHSREGNAVKHGNHEKEKEVTTSSKQMSHERRIWIPKTLRIDNPEEAAKSSIWATMGIKNDKTVTSSRGLFRAFQPKVEIKNHIAETSQVLRANPAALSRSINFQEIS